jgi:hypothetical protein
MDPSLRWGDRRWYPNPLHQLTQAPNQDTINISSRFLRAGKLSQKTLIYEIIKTPEALV